MSNPATNSKHEIMLHGFFATEMEDQSWSEACFVFLDSCKKQHSEEQVGES